MKGKIVPGANDPESIKKIVSESRVVGTEALMSSDIVPESSGGNVQCL